MGLRKWTKGRRDAVLQWHARSRENLVFTRQEDRAYYEGTDVWQLSYGEAASRRQFPDKESFLQFCEAFNKATGENGIFVSTAITGTDDEEAPNPKAAAEKILEEPTDSLYSIGLMSGDRHHSISFSSTHESGWHIGVRYQVRNPPNGGSNTSIWPDVGGPIERAVHLYTRRAPFRLSWNPWKSYPLIDVTPRAEVAQRTWQNKVQIRSAWIGLGGGVVGAFVVELIKLAGN